MAKTTVFSQVWGTGVVHPDYGIGTVPASQIYALRGRLSHSAMRRGGIMVGDVPLGDPAYLAPRLLGVKKTATPKFRVGLVSHYVDRSNPLILRMMKESGVADLNVHDPAEIFLANMAQCETVISSSLHGLVFAEALNIPNLWIRASDDIVGGEFKFRDWFSTARRPQTSFHLLTSHDTAETLAGQAECHESTIDGKALTAAFPLDRLNEMTLPVSRRIVPVLECRTRPTPVFLISLNRGDMLKRAICAIRGLTRPTEIIIHDDGSTYPETLTVLSELEGSGIKVFRYPAIHSAEEVNRIDETVSSYFADWGEPCRYVIAECNVNISAADPRALDVYDELLNTYPKVACVGPMLRIRDIPRAHPLFTNFMNHHIEQFWQHKPAIAKTSFGEVAIVPAAVDATFALHRAGEPFLKGKSGLRVYEPFEAKHTEWYEYGVDASTTAFATDSSGGVLNRDASLKFSEFYTVRTSEDGRVEIYEEQLGAPASAAPLPSPMASFSSASATERGARVAYVEALRLAGGSEIARWSQDFQHHPSWGERGEALARMVKPGETVFEFGAGRSRVPGALPAECAYTGSDLVPLSDGILPYDLNDPVLMPISGHDVALLSGVLEYVHDLCRIANFFANNFRGVVCSYAALRARSCQEIERRRYSGWFTDVTEDDFTALFGAAGFTLTRRGAWAARLCSVSTNPRRPETAQASVAIEPGISVW